MPKVNVRFNYHDYLLLPEDKRYEILDGELYVVPAPNTRHQLLLGEMYDALLHHVRDRGLGKVLLAPCDVVLSDETIAQPDLLFVCHEHLGIIGEANISGPPDLVIEILSPSSRKKDLEVKRKLYARFGIQEYWIVDPEAETIGVLACGEQGYVSAGLFDKSERLATPLLPELNLPLLSLFASGIRD
jgi:Uma2 family endonuclease